MEQSKIKGDPISKKMGFSLSPPQAHPLKIKAGMPLQACLIFIAGTESGMGKFIITVLNYWYFPQKIFQGENASAQIAFVLRERRPTPNINLGTDDF